MTTNTKPEYVTDVEHEKDCDAGRDSLYLYRQIGQSMTTEVESDHDGEFICAAGEWNFGEELTPVTLMCSLCQAQRYIVIDMQDNVIALTRDNCPRSSRFYGHFRGYNDKPCEYCGYAGKGASHVR